MARRVNKFTAQQKKTGSHLVPFSKFIPATGYTYDSYEFFKGRMRSPKMKNGFKLGDIKMFKDTNSNPDIERLYSRFFYSLMERMLFDFINGDTVVYDKKRDLKFHRWDSPMTLNHIKMKSKYRMFNIPLFDMKKTGYTIPTVMMDTGYKDKIGLIVKLPPYLYNVFLSNIYDGMYHTKLSGEMVTPDDYWAKKDEARARWQK